jgi:uncharacterized protein YdbL (DUF1318 family)
MTKLFQYFLLVFALISVPAFAADLDRAKSDGLVGERADGYLGVVDAGAGADVVALVADVNAKRKAEYQRIAQKNDLTLEQVQALAGKKAIARTTAGHWILVNGGWQKK